MIKFYCLCSLLAAFTFCGTPEKKTEQPAANVEKTIPLKDSILIRTGNLKPEDLIGFAESLKGTPYKYGSSDPATGFDCSGFISYVFNHFHVAVPRSTGQFSTVARRIGVSKSKPGDLIIFTGTDSTKHSEGHMGIITRTDANGIEFIHSTSGKAYSVTTTPLNAYYQGRYMYVIKIFR